MLAGGMANGEALSRPVVMRTLFLAVVVVVPLCALAAYLYRHDRASERLIHEREALSVVDVGAEAIARHARVVESDLLFLQHQNLLDRFLSGTPGSREALEAEYLDFCRSKKIYDQVRVIDRTGQEVLRVNSNRGRPAIVPRDKLQVRATPEYLRRTVEIEAGEIHVSAFDLNVEQGSVEEPLKPVIRFSASVFDRAGQRRGMVILNFLGEHLLRALADSSRSFEGSLFLINEEGYYLKGPDRDSEWGFVFGNERSFGQDHPQAWRLVSGGDRRQFVNGQGLYAFRPVRIGRFPEDVLTVVAWVPQSVMGRAAKSWRERALYAGSALLPLVLAGAWYVSYAGHRQRAHERRVEESESRLRTLSQELLAAGERERSALSRDLHDDLGQLVTSITLDLERAQQVPDGRRAQAIERALLGARQLLARLHAIATRVRPRILDELGLRDAVRSYLTEFQEGTGILVKAELHLDERPLPRVLSENVYRILQEALTNVSKHARCSRVEVVLSVEDPGLSLRIEDRGAGFDPELPTAGLGLLGMRERVELLGGSLTLRSVPDAGTRIEIVLPVAERA